MGAITGAASSTGSTTELLVRGREGRLGALLRPPCRAGVGQVSGWGRPLLVAFGLLCGLGLTPAVLPVTAICLCPQAQKTVGQPRLVCGQHAVGSLAQPSLPLWGGSSSFVLLSACSMESSDGLLIFEPKADGGARGRAVMASACRRRSGKTVCPPRSAWCAARRARSQTPSARCGTRANQPMRP